jgi:dinuclear metal center YbgI/SA1388 family protein
MEVKKAEMIKIKDISSWLETIAPLSYQESYDNCGLLTGSPDTEVNGILISLDVTEAVVEEAISKKCNLIVAHHPIIFKGLKKLTGSNYIERTIIKALKNDIAIYAIHTNLDNVKNGVNAKIAEKLGLSGLRILSPRKQLLKKLITFIPINDTDKVMNALYAAGAGNIGNYSECSFQVEGTGTFKPNEMANPTIGNASELERVNEKRVEVIFPSYLESAVLKALFEAHPYEEPAFDLLLLENTYKEVGSGMIGELQNSLNEAEFLNYLKEKMNLSVVRHTILLGQKIQKVAVCGGSGSFLLKDAIRQGAQVFVTSDFKYHEFFDAENKIVIADIGHYESEVFTKDLILELLKKKISNIALVLSETVTNPIRYT